MWRVLGVTTTFVVTDAPTYYAFMQSGQPYDLARSAWFADFPDAENYLFLAQTDNKVLNYSHFSNAEYDGLLRQATSEPDAGKRRDILHPGGDPAARQIAVRAAAHDEGVEPGLAQAAWLVDQLHGPSPRPRDLDRRAPCGVG